MINTGELSRLAQSSDPTLSGWASLSLAVRRAHGSMASTDQAISAWRSSHPRHPASTELFDSIRLASSTQSRQPARIALLLPISSRYAQAAGAIRDGITAMNNDLAASQRYDIRLYDYGSKQDLVALYYRQAVNNGASLIIGPLGRSATSQLLSAAEITVPTILLSPAPESINATENLYTFALSPEQEARQAAQRTWLDGRRTAVMMYPKDALGIRMAQAYRAQFTRLGGRIIGEAFYDSASGEGYSAQISKLLGVDQSEQRINELSRRLGTKLKHEARRRQDIEAIFLPATTDDARLITPEVDFYYALDLPVYTTSRIFSGKLDTVNYADLNRVRFTDMPLMIGNNVEIESLRTFRQVEQTNEGNRYDRLYAIGMDLHGIAAQLENLSAAPQLYLQGLTGNLHITDDGIVEHDMIWAEFQNGTPKLLDRNSGYQGRYDEWKYKSPARAAPAARQ
jgi:outer membrane PBP1 activator LpoA protein